LITRIIFGDEHRSLSSSLTLGFLQVDFLGGHKNFGRNSRFYLAGKSEHATWI
jgi:hypothetical protein